MGKHQHALVVEDRQDWQTILSRTLTSIGWTVNLASTYEEALELLLDNFYELAVIDPVLDNTNKFNRDGLRVLVEIRGKYPETALVVVSGSVNQEVLNSHPNLPENLNLVEKQKWNREEFIKLVRHLTHQEDIGKTTVISRLKATQKVTPPAQNMPTPPSDSERKGEPRILIVEDRPDWQVILAKAMEDEGWFWRYTTSAGMALELLQDDQQVFHVVLLDLRLGDAEVPLQEGEGWHLLDFLANSDRRTRVIIISGEASRGDVAALFTRYPIDGFIDKDTFKKNELLELIYKVVAKPKVRVQTLGNFQVWRDGLNLNDFGSQEAEVLLKILVSKRGEVISKNQLIRWLFPFTNTGTLGQPRPALEIVVNTVRRLLEPDLAAFDSSAFIVEKEDGFMLDMTQPVTLDFDEIEEKLNEGKTLQSQGNDEGARQIYEAARELYQGEYLPLDRMGQWSIARRGYVEKQYARLLNRLADLYAKQGDFKQAISITQHCLQIDSYHESTHRRLMRYHTCQGNTKAALTVYTTWEKLKREFFQEEPSAETQALREAILNGTPVDCIEQHD